MAPTKSRESWTSSMRVSRFWERMGWVTAVTGGIGPPRGIGPKYFSTSARAFAGSKSPTITSEALLGT